MTIKIININQTHSGTGHNISGDYICYSASEDSLNRDLSLAIIIGAWSESVAHDIEIIELITDEPYDSWIRKIQAILEKPTPPIKHHMGDWEVIDYRSKWSSALSRLYKKDLERFKEAAIRVFSQIDTRLNLPPEKRNIAELYGVKPYNSSLLRTGIANSLALLNIQSEDAENVPHFTCSSISSEVVSQLLSSSKWEQWASLNDIAGQLAEAAPNTYLTKLEALLTSSKHIALELFAQKQNHGIHSTTYASGLISGLERLAWFPEYLTRSVLALGELQQVTCEDPLSTRLTKSIINILSPEPHNTSAPFQRRLITLTTLHEELPELAWTITLELLPQPWRTHQDNSHPVFLSSPASYDEGSPISREDQYAALGELAIKLAQNNPTRLLQLISNISRLLEIPSALKHTLEAILNNTATLDKEQSYKIWSTLTSLTKNQNHQLHNYALPKELLHQAIAATESKLPELYHRKLFSNTLPFQLENFETIEDLERTIEHSRSSAIREIYRHGDFYLVAQFSNSVENPKLAGTHLAKLVESEHAETIKELIAHPSRHIQNFIASYIRERSHITDMAFIEAMDLPVWSPDALITLFTNLPFTPKTWHAIEALSKPDLASQYWSKVTTSWPGYIEYTGPESLYFAHDQFLAQRRPLAALHCLCHLMFRENTLKTQSAVITLNQLITTQTPIPPEIYYDVRKIISFLRNHGEISKNDLLYIEFAYCQILKYDKSELKLHHELSNNPNLFHSFISSAHPSEKFSQAPKATANQQRIQLQMRCLFGTWKTIPGSGMNFDTAQFDNWIEQVLLLCEASGHRDAALRKIAALLVNSPEDSDGFWINRHIAKFLNNKTMDTLREYYVSATLEARGAHEISPSALPERLLAKKYEQRADQCEASGFFRIAIALRQIRQYYDDFAKTITRGDTKLFNNHRYNDEDDFPTE
jgi:hypothetical protein